MSILSTIFRGEKYIKQSTGYEKMSEWQLAKDVEFTDGKDGETKLGAIDGITSDINGTSDNVAASIKVVNELNSNLGGLRFGIDGDGNYGYYGADDSLVPFSSNGMELIGSFSGTMPTVNIYDGKQHEAISNSTITVDSLPSENTSDYIVVITCITTGGGGGNSIAAGKSLNAYGNFYPILSISDNIITIQNTGFTRMIATQPGIEVYYKYALSGNVYYIG